MAMKVFILFFFLCSYSYAQQGHLILPTMSFPDSITGFQQGFISIDYGVNQSGEIISYNISRIVLWSARKNKFITLYRSYGVENTGYRNLRGKNTKAGLIWAKKLTPWVREYCKLTKFETTKEPMLGEAKERRSLSGSIFLFSHQVEFGGGKAMMKKRAPALPKPTPK